MRRKVPSLVGLDPALKSISKLKKSGQNTTPLGLAGQTKYKSFSVKRNPWSEQQWKKFFQWRLCSRFCVIRFGRLFVSSRQPDNWWWGWPHTGFWNSLATWDAPSRGPAHTCDFVILAAGRSGQPVAQLFRYTLFITSTYNNLTLETRINRHSSHQTNRTSNSRIVESSVIIHIKGLYFRNQGYREKHSKLINKCIFNARSYKPSVDSINIWMVALTSEMH